MTEQTCGSCRFFNALWGEDSEDGQCRRFPPNVPSLEDAGGGSLSFVWDHGVAMVEFPVVLWDGWCGEWKENE